VPLYLWIASPQAQVFTALQTPSNSTNPRSQSSHQPIADR